MSGFLPVGYGNRDRDNLPHVIAPVRPHSCTDCIKHGLRCAGLCGRKACRAHAYQCSRCDGVLCEACWTRHEVQVLHVPASPAEVEASSKAPRDWPHQRRVHVRTGRYPSPNPKPNTEMLQ